VLHILLVQRGVGYLYFVQHLQLLFIIQKPPAVIKLIFDQQNYIFKRFFKQKCFFMP